MTDLECDLVIAKAEIEALKLQLAESQRREKTAVDRFVADLIESLQVENERLRQWVNDLQSGMYVNCVYCGHRYGPEDQVPSSMADALKAHIEQCPEHPMSHLKAQLSASQRRAQDARNELCQKCGRYREAHKGACDGCRWMA